MKFKRCFAAVAILCIVFCSLCTCFTASAQEAAFSLHIQKYDAAQKKYTDCTAVYPDDAIRVAVSSDAIDRIGGIRAILHFDNSVLEVKGDSSGCAIEDDSAILSFAADQQKATASVIWFTNKQNISANGDMFYFYFKAKVFVANATLHFSLDIAELYDSQNVDIAVEDTVEATIPAIANTIPEEELAAFRKLLVIEYTDACLENISAADRIFSGYSSTQVLILKTQHPDLYNAYMQAQNKYNDLALKATQQQAQKEADQFLARNSVILAKDVENITASDLDSIATLSSEYNALSPRAKLVIDQATKDKIDALAQKVEQIQQNRDDAAAAETFKQDYAALWNLDYDTLKTEETYRTLVSESQMVYEMMLSDGAKALLGAEKNKLDTLSAWCDEIASNNAAEQKISAEVSAFQEQWIYVLTLNTANVEIADKSAIELMLQDLAGQSTEVQERLSARKSSAEQLLAVLDTLEQDIHGQEDGANTVIVPSAPNEIVNTQTIVKTQTKTETVQDTVTEYVGNVPKIIVVLSVILAVSFVLLLLPTITYIYLSSKTNKEEL